MDLRNKWNALIILLFSISISILFSLLGYLHFKYPTEDDKYKDDRVPGKGNSIILLKDGIVQTVIPVEKVAETCIDGQVVIVSWKKEKCDESNKR